MTPGILHALATGLLIAATYAVVDKAGMLANKTLARKLFILLPVYFVVILIFNLLWPYGTKL